MLKKEQTDLFYQLTGESLPVYFRVAAEVDQTTDDLAQGNYAVCEIDGSCVVTLEDLSRECAIALRMPAGFYGAEKFATNGNAFLEYLDDVAHWIPAAGHVLIVRNASALWREAPETAGALVEFGQFAKTRGSTVRIVFAL